VSVTIPASAILLDMDGTLVDSTAVVERVWRDWAADHGLDVAAVLDLVHGRQGQESMAILLPGRPVEQNLVENEQMLERETRETDGVVAIPGAAALMASLDGIPHALVTSATVALAAARMQAAGLDVPAVAVTAEDVSASKPDPEGFLAAAAELGVPATDCVVFEDSAAGIAAARAAQMRVVGVGVGAKAYGPDWTVPDLTGVVVVAGGAGVRIELRGRVVESAGSTLEMT
jgi:sugar-phosphatase